MALSWASCSFAGDKAKAAQRITFVRMDITDEATIADAAATVAALPVSKDTPASSKTNVRLFINSSGYLLPEKSLRNVDKATVLAHFETNCIGPLLVAKHFSGLLMTPRKDAASAGAKSTDTLPPFPIWINMSARTGSIGDNHLGGWHSYRMSKAALNQLTKTMAVELGRKGASVISLHPGTVDTDLSRNFVKGVDPAKLFTPEKSVDLMMQVIRQLNAEQNGSFLDFAGKQIPW
eukprot:jgi/Hompol1/6146/HPOL_002651-RA